MKKSIYIITLILSLLFVFILKPLPVYAWDDCPKGKVNDPYPGDCTRYVDTDNNGICDRSEPAPEDRIIEVKEVEVNKEIPPETISDNTARGTNNNLWSKSLLAFSILISHLAAILIYTSYKKAKLQKL